MLCFITTLNLSRWFSGCEMPSLWSDCAKRESRLRCQGNLQLWDGAPHEVKAPRGVYGGGASLLLWRPCCCLSGEKLNQILFLPSWQILTLDGCRMMLCKYHFKMMIKKVNIMYSWFQEILILWIHSLKWNSGIYLKKEWNSGPSISRFMMDTLCFFHVVLAFLLTLTVDRFETSTESENVFSDVSNLLQWLSDNPNSTPGSLHKMVKWSPNHYWPTFALKAYRWIRKIRHFLPRHKYSLNP